MGTIKVAINADYGGFRLSDKALKWLIEERGWKVLGGWAEVEELQANNAYPPKEPEWLIEEDRYTGFGGLLPKYHMVTDDDDPIIRTHKDIIDVVELMGKEASAQVADIKIVEIPDDVEWTIEEYDGVEWIAEKHRTWS